MLFWKAEPLSASSGGQRGVWPSLLGSEGLRGHVQSACFPGTAEAASWQGLLVPPCPHCLLCLEQALPACSECAWSPEPLRTGQAALEAWVLSPFVG